jgi:hypothetical protein
MRTQCQRLPALSGVWIDCPMRREKKYQPILAWQSKKYQPMVRGENYTDQRLSMIFYL